MALAMSGKMCIFAASRETEKSNSMKRFIRLSAVWAVMAVGLSVASEGIAQDTIFPWDCPRYLTKGRPTEGHINYYPTFGHRTATGSQLPQIFGYSFYAPGATVYGLAVSIERTGWVCSTGEDQMNHVAHLGSLAVASRT